MHNIFKPYIRRHSQFSYGRIGDIDRARVTLGSDVPIGVYRLMFYTMTDALVGNIGAIQTRHIFREAGRLAGSEFVFYSLLLEDPPDAFFASLEEAFARLKIGALRVERYDPATGEVAFTLEQGLTAGLPSSGGLAHHFDEGMLTGVMESYTDKTYFLECAAPPAGGEPLRLTGRPA